MRGLKPFEYIEAPTVEEASRLLSGYGDRGILCAGGVDLIPRMRNRKIKPEYVVNIQKIPGLDYIKGSGKEGLRIGALTSIRAVELSPAVRKDYVILYEAAHQLSSVQVKTMGTLAGNLCVGTPASDMAACLIALGAELRIAGSGGDKTVPVENFYVGVGQTILKPGDIVSEILLPAVKAGTGGGFLNLVRTAADISKVNTAVIITVTDATCREARIALGAVAPTVFRAKKAEAILKGQKLGTKVIEAAGEAAAGETKPITDLRSTAEYRRDVTRVLVMRALNKAVERAKS